MVRNPYTCLCITLVQKTTKYNVFSGFAPHFFRGKCRGRSRRHQGGMVTSDARRIEQKGRNIGDGASKCIDFYRREGREEKSRDHINSIVTWEKKNRSKNLLGTKEVKTFMESERGLTSQTLYSELFSGKRTIERKNRCYKESLSLARKSFKTKTEAVFDYERETL